MARIKMICVIYFYMNASFHAVLCQEFDIRNDTNCTLAAPDITYSSDGNYIQLPGNITDTIKQGGKIQVGYMETFGVFQYKGCSDIPNIFKQSGIKNFSVRSDPGQCYSACKTSSFAISDTVCYCLPKLDNKDLKEEGCDKQCSDPKNTLCGGKANDKASVYEYKFSYSTDHSLEEYGHNCWAYTTSGSFEWKNCANKLTCICQLPGRPYLLETKTNWKDCFEACLQNEMLPSSESTVKSDVGGQNDMWIGTIKSLVIKTQQGAYDSRLDSNGYVEWNTKMKRSDLLFGSKFSLDGSKVLCSEERETSTRKESFAGKDSQRQSGNYMIAVYVLVAIVVAVLVSIVVYRQFGERCKLDKRYYFQYMSDVQHSTNNEPHNRKNNTYDEKFDPISHAEIHPEYHILEPPSTLNNTNQRVTNVETHSNNTAFEEDYEDYDNTSTATTERTLIGQDTSSNVYNGLNEDWQLYDHSTDRVMERKDMRVDDRTYDHTEKDESFKDLYEVIG